uniref:NBS-coding resistance gene analog n=1 Tax=Solanum tuberosum TaxID=4113 RepID=M1A2J4_SOLTU
MEVVETCGKGTLSAGEPSTKRSITSIYDDEEVVGFEKDAEIIMKKLIRGTKERDVISIYGMPGLGKTTLARKVYNNPTTVNYFDVKAWCAVSQTYNRRGLLVEIFKQATSNENEIKEDVDIADMLRKSLIGRRYLIVLDDIWDVEAWEDLGICFPEGEYGSRVMVTTRIEQVAKHLQVHSVPYSLSFLTSEESWELLEKKVFRGESCPPDLLEAGLQVALHFGWERNFVFPSNLRHLNLRGCFLTEEMVLNIARLKKLESLKLHMGFPFMRLQRLRNCCWNVTNVEFPALKYLGLFFVQIEEWKASEESFPVLEKLVISGCSDFKEIPPSFADIPTLRRIELTNCIDSLGVSAMNIRRDIEENTGCDSLHVLIVNRI